MDELEALKQIDEALSALDDAAKVRVLSWANQKFASGSLPTATISMPSGTPKPAPKSNDEKAAKGSKKPKSILAVDKNINLFPKYKPSAVEFASEKSPSNAKQEGVVAIYYVRETLGYEKVGISQVAAFFKAVAWPMPADLANTLQQAGTEVVKLGFGGADVEWGCSGGQRRAKARQGRFQLGDALCVTNISHAEGEALFRDLFAIDADHVRRIFGTG